MMNMWKYLGKIDLRSESILGFSNEILDIYQVIVVDVDVFYYISSDEMNLEYNHLNLFVNSDEISI